MPLPSTAVSRTLAGALLATATLTVAAPENLGMPPNTSSARVYAGNSSGAVGGDVNLQQISSTAPYGQRIARSVNGGIPTVLPLPSDGEYSPTNRFGEAASRDMAETGAILGSYRRWVNGNGVQTAAIWQADGSVTALPSGSVNPYAWSAPEAISPAGTYVVGAATFATYTSGRARWRVGDEAPTQLPPSTYSAVYAYDVNDAGVVVGYGWRSDLQRYFPVRWRGDAAATLTQLGDLVPPGATTSRTYRYGSAYAVLADGSAVGYQEVDADGSGPFFGMRPYAVRWDVNGNATDITPAGAAYAVAYGANEAGMVFMWVCVPTTGCRYGILLDGVFTGVPGIGFSNVLRALSPSANGTAYLVGGSSNAFLRVRLTTSTPNAAPTISFASPTVATDEGTATTVTATVTDDGPSPHTFTWDLYDGQTHTAATTSTSSLTFTPADGLKTYRVTVTVTDGAGARSTAAAIDVVAANVAPTATFSATPTSLPEGSAVPFALALSNATDAGPADRLAGFTYAFSCGAATVGSFGTSSSATCSATDDGTPTVRGAVRDKDGEATEYTERVTITNVAPDVTALTLPSAPVPIGTTVSATAIYRDQGLADTHQAEFTWDWNLAANNGLGAAAENAAVSTVAGAFTNGPTGQATSTTSYTMPGVYTVRVQVADDDGGEGTRTSKDENTAYIVVYDPTAGFVTGGGWILSPDGACDAVVCAGYTGEGKATFGFVSKYQKGKTEPTGNTEFQFSAGGFRFTSTIYQWLVVSGPQGQFKGEGTVNGQSGYGFLLTAVDGQAKGGGGVDKFRIKVWELSSGRVVYDNQRGQAEDSGAATVLGGGSIVIH